jgi:superfamily II DNA helicase RecQ
MHLKVFTLRFSSLTGGFDDQPVQQFLSDKRVLSVQEHFYEFDHVPYLTLLVTYEAVTSKKIEPEKKSKSDKTPTVHWKDLVDEADAPLFETIREWRNQTAKTLGIPSYVICNNNELAMLLKSKPTTLTELLNVEGFGKGKVEKYGESLIQFFNHEQPNHAEQTNDG